MIVIKLSIGFWVIFFCCIVLLDISFFVRDEDCCVGWSCIMEILINNIKSDNYWNLIRVLLSMKIENRVVVRIFSWYVIFWIKIKKKVLFYNFYRENYF